MEVGEGPAALGDIVFVVSEGANVGLGRIIMDPVGGAELIKDSDLPLIPPLLHETTNGCLVVYS
jgi:hypothetical protein